MPIGGDIVELVHEQTYLGQAVNNVYYFESVDGSTPLPTLAAWFETNVVPLIKLNQVDLLTHVNLRLRNLFDPIETHEEPLTGTGGSLSETEELPAFFAMTVRFDHTSGDVRPGFKRWSGVEEGFTADGLILPAVVTRMTDIADMLINPPAVANPGWVHVIVGRVCDEPNPVVGAVPSCFKYVLPRTQAEAVIGGIGYPISYEAYSQPTTQNSRKWYT